MLTSPHFQIGKVDKGLKISSELKHETYCRLTNQAFDDAENNFKLKKLQIHKK